VRLDHIILFATARAGEKSYRLQDISAFAAPHRKSGAGYGGPAGALAKAGQLPFFEMRNATEAFCQTAKRRVDVSPEIVWDEPPSRGMDRPKYKACLAVARAASGGGTPDNQDSLTILGRCSSIAGSDPGPIAANAISNS
jgi:hypothetical protein